MGMADRVPVTKCPTFRLTVRCLTRIAPSVTRMVAGGPALASYQENGFTDAHVRILFPLAGVAYPGDFHMRRIRSRLPREERQPTRTYTVRSIDRAAGELAVEFFDHGQPGLARSWLAALSPGDDVLMQGPGGSYRPGKGAAWHLFAGDQAALPAIAAALEVLDTGVPVRALIEVMDAADERPLVTRADLKIRWLHQARGDDLVRAIKQLRFDAGPVDAFVHGEAVAMQELRRHLLRDRGLRRDHLSISGYWRRGMNDDTWRAWKAARALGEAADDELSHGPRRPPWRRAMRSGGVVSDWTGAE
jgi:NADPH-dependent ferric siderophore reductase